MRYLKENLSEINIPTFAQLASGIQSNRIQTPLYGNLRNRFFFPDLDTPICSPSDLKLIESSYYTYAYAIFRSPRPITGDKYDCIIIFEDGDPICLVPKTDGAIKFESALIFWKWYAWGFQTGGLGSLPRIYRQYDLFIFNLDSYKIQISSMETPYKFKVEADEFTFEMPYRKVIKCREKRTGIVKFFDLKLDEFFGPPSKVHKDKT
jgi:hypothetical protein